MHNQSSYLNKMLVYLVVYFVSQLLPVQSGITVPRSPVIALNTPAPLSPSPVVLGKTSIQPVVQPSLVKPSDALEVALKRIVDGDTLQVMYEGKSTKVRLIGINTPEVVDPRRPVQCFGKEASNRAKELTVGKTVFLSADPTQADRDKYDRLLRYVWLPDGTNLNYEMIAEGYAFEYTYDIPYQYQTLFKQAQKSAQSKGSGLWAQSSCQGALRDVIPSP